MNPSTNPVLAAVLAAPLLVASAASAGLEPWDQEKVTAIAAELPPATRALAATLRQKPQKTLGQPGRASFLLLRDQVRSIDATARRLHSSLEAGEGREATLPIYRRMLRTVRDAERELGRIPAQQGMDEGIDAVADILRRLQVFYEELSI